MDELNISLTGYIRLALLIALLSVFFISTIIETCRSVLCFLGVIAPPDNMKPYTTATSTSTTHESSPHTPLNAKYTPEITKEVIDLPRASDKGKLAFVLRNVLSKEECKNWIADTEKWGYEPALVNVGYGRQEYMPDYRSNYRSIHDSVPQAEELYRRLKPFLPQEMCGRKIVGLNERLRFLRYDKGELFDVHFDGCFVRTAPGPQQGERSLVTVQLYLNEGFEGGSTTFVKGSSEGEVEGDVRVVPETGMVLIFEHALAHCGSALIEGRKYAMRTDVMYSKQ